MTETTGATIAVGLERDRALCRSLVYEALSLGFRPPDDRTRARLVDADSVAALSEAVAMLDEGQGDGLVRLTHRLAEPAAGAGPEDLVDSYAQFFGYVVRAPIPAYETEYGKDSLFQKPHELSDISAFLSAFGLTPDPQRHERVDHIACELEFLAFLARKEAHAHEAHDRSMLDATVRATRLFLKEHLGRFVPSFARRIREADPTGFYGRLASLCLAFVTAECARHGLPLGSETMHLRSLTEDTAPMGCGVPGGCVPGPGGPEAGNAG